MGLLKPLTLENLNQIKSDGGQSWPYPTPPFLLMEIHYYINTAWVEWKTIYKYLTRGYFDFRADTYNQSWRVWAQQPTDDERDAAPWDFSRWEVDE